MVKVEIVVEVYIVIVVEEEVRIKISKVNGYRIVLFIILDIGGFDDKVLYCKGYC